MTDLLSSCSRFGFVFFSFSDQSFSYNWVNIWFSALPPYGKVNGCGGLKSCLYLSILRPLQWKSSILCTLFHAEDGWKSFPGCNSFSKWLHQAEEATWGRLKPEKSVHNCKNMLRCGRMKIWLPCSCAVGVWSSLFPELPTPPSPPPPPPPLI